MITRTATVYFNLPEELTQSKKRKEANAKISMSLVIPAEFEKKGQKFMDEMADEYSSEFKKFMKKQIKKFMEGDK